MNPLFEKEALERERKVILEEIKMYRDNPSSHVMEKIKELLYKNPFNMSIAGTQDTVKGLSREMVVDLYNSIYGTNNMIFCVVGNTTWESVLHEALRFPKRNKEIKIVPIIESNGEFIEKRSGIDQAHEVLGFHMPKLNDKNCYAAEIFDSLLGGGMSSRLFQEIREKLGLCYSIRSHLDQSKDYAYEMIHVGTTPDKVKEIKGIILKEILKLKDLKSSDFNEAKERLIGLRQITKEKCDSTMTELLIAEIGGDASNYYKYEEEINLVKLKQVQDLSKLNGYSFTALVPK